jgi:hypothetical protein
MRPERIGQLTRTMRAAVVAAARNGAAGLPGTGDCTPGAGDGAAEASGYARGAAVDRPGNLIIANQDRQPGMSLVLLVAASTGIWYGQAMTAGHIYTVAGDGTGSLSGDAGQAGGAELGVPGDAAVTAAASLVTGDTGDGRIRVAEG